MKIVKILMVVLMCAFVSPAAHAQVGPSKTEVRYLSGTGKDDAVLWDFFCTEGRRSGAWTKIPVPSNWETEGFGNYQYGGDRQREANPFPKEQGKYKVTFAVPERWRNRTVRLVFEGSMTDTEVWVNGHSAGPVHQGSFYQFKYDITSLLRFGESNLLEVTVSKESTNTSVNRAERLGDYWNFGGIFRPVFIESLPQQFIDWTAIDARADGNFSVDVNLGQPVVAGRVVGQIIDARGGSIGREFSELVPANASRVKLKTTISRPKLWTAETPNLYRVKITLFDSGRIRHTVTERFGFRTFEVRAGDGLYLNGQRILLKGVNRHSFWPESGRALSRKISDDDVKLIKEMNMNAVRMSHYPPDQHFLDACDELGLYVLDELGGWQKSYDTPTGRRLIGQIVRRDVNHPSILFWDNGNEGGWNRENDDEFARWDPQRREVLHPWEKFRLTNTDHYEKFDSHTRLANGPDIYMPTEFLHGLYDGGIGAGMWDYWELIRTSRVGGGGFFWALVDECVKRTDQTGKLDCAGNRAPDGIVGPHREKEGSFYTVREIWSPVKVTSAKDFNGEFTVENRYDFTNMRDCTFAWELARFPSSEQRRSGHISIASATVKGPDVAPHATGRLKVVLPPRWRDADVFYLTAKDPQGRELWTWSWELTRPSSIVSGPPEYFHTSENDETLTVDTGTLSLRFNKGNGYLDEVENRSGSLPIGSGPQFIAFRRNDRKYDLVAGESKLKRFATRREGNVLIVEVEYEGALRRVSWRITRSGKTVVAQLDYEYGFDGTVDMIGVEFKSADRSIDQIRWLGRGPYRVWQNRMEGTRLDVWQNRYNDSTPGESWIYPEFKGYFSDWRWATLESKAGSFTLSTPGNGSFLGLFKPKDGVNGLLDLPDIGVAFLDVIPAMRNKFHTTDEIGPQSKPKQVSGTVKRRVEINFGG